MRQALVKEENRILNFKIKIATLLMIVLSVYTLNTNSIYYILENESRLNNEYRRSKEINE